MQRVAVARGLGHNPPLLLADEPTANLDHIQAEAIIRLLQSLRDDGRMIVVSTHDSRLVPIADRIVQMVPPDQHEERADPRRHLRRGRVDLRAGRRRRPGVRDQVGRGRRDPVLADGGEERLNRLGPDQYFGELGPFLGFPVGVGACHDRRRADRLQPPRVREKVLHKTDGAGRTPPGRFSNGLSARGPATARSADLADAHRHIRVRRRDTERTETARIRWRGVEGKPC